MSKVNLSTQQITNRVKKLRSLEEQAAQLEKEMKRLKEEIQADMLSRDCEELQAGHYIVRWTRTTAQRLDTKAFRVAYEDLYSRFLKPTESRRFSIAEI